VASALDDSIRGCGDLAEWLLALEDRLALLDGKAPLPYLAGRCSDGDLSRYAVCHSLERALATPPPTPRATSKPKPTPDPTAWTPRTTPSPRRAADVAGHQRAVCGAVALIRRADYNLSSWRTLPDTARRLNYELAMAAFGFDGATGEEAAARERIARIQIRQEWRSLESEFRQDAGWIGADLSGARRLLADAPYWSRGSRFKGDLLDVVGQLDNRASSIGRWFDREKEVSIDAVFTALDRTEQNLGRVLRSAPFGCG
jgi:hypothetical protein